MTGFTPATKLVCAECGADLEHAQRPIMDIKTRLCFDRYDCHLNYFQRPIMEKNLAAGVVAPPKETEKL